MKKVLCILIAIGMIAWLPTAACASWVTANQCTVHWDENDTSALAEGERLVYRVHLTNVITDPSKSNPALAGETQENSLLITLGAKGQYMAGVEAVLQVRQEDAATWEDVSTSEISWSDDPTVTKDGLTFGIRFYPAPLQPTGLIAG